MKKGIFILSICLCCSSMLWGQSKSKKQPKLRSELGLNSVYMLNALFNQTAASEDRILFQYKYAVLPKVRFRAAVGGNLRFSITEKQNDVNNDFFEKRQQIFAKSGVELFLPISVKAHFIFGVDAFYKRNIIETEQAIPKDKAISLDNSMERGGIAFVGISYKFNKRLGLYFESYLDYSYYEKEKGFRYEFDTSGNDITYSTGYGFGAAPSAALFLSFAF